VHVVPPHPRHRADLLGKPQTETMALSALRRKNEKVTQMNDYADPLIQLREWDRKYTEAMRDKRPEQAKIAAVKIIRLAVDLLEIAEGK